MTTSDSDSPGINTCANCFADFEWTPFTQDGEDFCCSGCADGGPCICTYDGAPHLSDDGSVLASASSPEPDDQPLSDDDQPDEAGQTAASASEQGGGPPEPPAEPPAPVMSPDEDEPPTNGRLAIIMGAISEMPFPVQEVVRARLSTDGPDDRIGEPLGLSGDEVSELIEQGQAILDRTIGPGFRIRYIGADEIAEDDAPEPEFPSFEDTEAGTVSDGGAEPAARSGADGPNDVASTELSRLIARSLDSLTAASVAEGPGQERARDVISEALREVGHLFGLASERLGDGDAADVPLREALADARGDEEPVTLIVENQPDIAPFFMALQDYESVRWVRLQRHSPARTEFELLIDSMMGFVRDLMTMDGQLRPTRLQMSGDEITVELPAQAVSSAVQQPPAPVPSPVAIVSPGPAPSAAPTVNEASRGQRFELSVDSFFGARHFVESSSSLSAPHHHSYRVEASFTTSEQNGRGFVVGFASIREMVDSTVMAYSETLLNTEDPFLRTPPTTENLAKVFYQKISEKLLDHNEPSVSLDRVRVWESPTNSATYSIPGTGAGPDAAVAS